MRFGQKQQGLNTEGKYSLQ